MDFDDELYREIIMEHYRDKKFKHSIKDADLEMEGANPVCGDDITLYLKIDNGMIREASYDGVGCSICSASADLLAESIQGRSVEEARGLVKKFKSMILEDADPDFPSDLSDLEALQGVKKLPVRIKCALLSWNTLEQMLQEKK